MNTERKLALINKIFYYAARKYDTFKANGNTRFQTKCCMVMDFANYMLDKYEA